MSSCVFPSRRSMWQCVFAVLVATRMGGHHAQEPDPPVRFGATTAAVVLDVVVRDRDGRLVSTLTSDDFTVLEDGVAQTIVDARWVGAPRKPSPSAPPAERTSGEPEVSAQAGTSTPTDHPAFVALLFDRLSPEARAAASEAAMAYVAGTNATDYTGVFVSDLSLVTLQTYTNNQDAVRRAIEEATTRVTSKFERRDLLKPTGGIGDTHPAASPTASAEFQGPADLQTQRLIDRQPDTVRDPVYGPIKMAEIMERTFEALDRDQQGHATLNALLALITSLGPLPGRKTVIFFAEALALPPAVASKFESVIATANRYNVTVYSVDAAGLRVHSKNAEVARQINDIGALSADDRRRGGGAWTRDLERNEDLLRADPAVGLATLASSTGGLIVNNTNDLAAKVMLLNADRRHYYLVSYHPRNAELNGEWRTVEVTVPGRRVSVRSRSGYLASPATPSFPILTYEGPALAALAKSPPPADIPVQAGVFTFPEPTGTRVALLVATAGDALSFSTSDGRYHAQFAIVALTKTAHGEVVRKDSQPYVLDGRVSDLPGTQAGLVLFYRTSTLDPGEYVVETGVYDALARRTGVTRTPFDVPISQPGLAVSSLVVVDHTEPADAGDGNNPLVVGTVLAYPNLGRPIPRTPAGTVALLISLIAASDPTATLELLAGGTSLARAPLPLPPRDLKGRVKQVWSIPVSALEPGVYTLRVKITAGTASASRDATITIVQ